MHTTRATRSQPASRYVRANWLSAAESTSSREASTLLETHLTAARPRLLRAIQAWGISPDLAEDIVQETLLAAWQHQEQVQSHDRIDAWLISIAHNCARMQFRRMRPGRPGERPPVGTVHVPVPDAEMSDGADPLTTIPAPDSPDPLEGLERCDMVTFLNRALGYLSQESRTAVELCYLAELPQRTGLTHETH